MLGRSGEQEPSRGGACSWFRNTGECQQSVMSDDESPTTSPSEIVALVPVGVAEITSNGGGGQRSSSSTSIVMPAVPGVASGGGGSGATAVNRQRSRSARKTAALRETLNEVREAGRRLSVVDDVLAEALGPLEGPFQ